MFSLYHEILAVNVINAINILTTISTMIILIGKRRQNSLLMVSSASLLFHSEGVKNNAKCCTDAVISRPFATSDVSKFAQENGYFNWRQNRMHSSTRGVSSCSVMTVQKMLIIPGFETSNRALKQFLVCWCVIWQSLDKRHSQEIWHEHWLRTQAMFHHCPYVFSCQRPHGGSRGLASASADADQFPWFAREPFTRKR